MKDYKTLLSPPTLENRKNMIVKDSIAIESPVESYSVSSKKLQEQRRRARSFAKQQQMAERLAAATEELSAGIEEAHSSIDELQQSLEQMATGAEQASAACEESTQSISKISEHVTAIAENSTHAMNKSMVVQQMVTGTSHDINRLIQGVASSAKKSSQSAQLIGELEKQAKEVEQIISTVVNIADQTNLLALNAAIEAARAGDHGSGFAVVADEVRTLAETSERSANDIREVIESIQTEVNTIAQAIKHTEELSIQEMRNGEEINHQLFAIGHGMQEFVEKTKEIYSSVGTLKVSIMEFESGSRTIALTAEEQASSVNQAIRAIQEQNRAMSDINQSTIELADMAEELRTSKEIAKASETLASAAEELSMAITETSQSSKEIMFAINSIDQSAAVQSTATEQSSQAVQVIESAIKTIAGIADGSENKIREVKESHDQSKKQTEILIKNITQAVKMLGENLEMILSLEQRIRQINKIVNTIDKVSIQTNMLAVNGAIEAAGAGKYGRGFSVVASDIRNLAHESAVNADEIKDLVREIQDQVSMVVRDLMLALDSSKAEVEKAQNIIRELEKIDDELLPLVEGVTRINRSLTELDSAIMESNRAIEQIATAAEQAASAAKHASHAGQEQSIGFNELSRAIEEIAMMTDEIQI